MKLTVTVIHVLHINGVVQIYVNCQ